MNPSSLQGANEVLQFLQTLYGEEDLERGHLVCFTLPNHQAKWFWNGERQEFAEYALSVSKESNVYLGLGLQDKEETLKEAEKLGKKADESRIRGYKKTVCVIPGVWLDIDVKGPAHKADNLPDTFEDAEKIIEKFPLRPTMMVNSGHGYQVYWLFKEPWVIESEEELQEAQEFVDNFLRTIQYHASSFG
ncbi:hypothetical protein RZN22_13365, partial [Bacillaceae bacterium S4-13-58]